MSDPFYAIRQLATHALASAFPNATTQGWAQDADAAVQAHNQDYQQNWRQGQPQTGIDWGRMVGQGLAMAPITGALPTGSSMLGRAALGAATGGVSGALSPVQPGDDFWQQKAGQALGGVAAGGVAGPLVSAVGGIPFFFR